MTINSGLLFYASITFLLLTFVSCRTAKYLDDEQALVADVDFEGMPVALKEQAYAYVSNEIRPNSVLNLTIYNIFNTADGRYKRENIRQVGQAPHILDTSLVELSATQIQRFLHTKGYFNAEVTPAIAIKNKKARIDFNVKAGNPYLIQNLTYEFEDQQIGNIYLNEVKPTSLIGEGQQYDAAKLLAEREKLYVSSKNRGYFDYLRQYMRVGVDTNVVGDVANLHVQILKPDSGEHHIYSIKDIYLNIRSDQTQKSVDQERMMDNNRRISFLDETGDFRLSPISRYMFLRAGQLYSLENENLSYDRLYEMNGFRSVKIQYERVDSNRLNVHYDLIPRSTMANQIEGEYTFSSGMSGFNVGNTFSHRNVFGGSELLEVKLRYGVLFDPRLEGSISDKIFNNDFQVGVNLVVPRLMTPFRVRGLGRYGLPRTTFSSSVQLFNQDRTYSNRYFINTLNYSWWQTPNLQHSYTPLVLEYRIGRFDEDFKTELEQEGYRLYVESNDREYFGLGSQYSITWNAPKLLLLEDFSFLKGSVDVSGNTLGLLSNIFDFKQDNFGQRTLLGAPYLQYIKGDFDYRLYKHLGGQRQFVWRFNAGIAVPYGNNSRLLIFEKRFFSGGMNGIRAWQARTLGPGNYNREGLSENLRLNLRNLDQLGEVKLETNMEYRFRILNNFFGAKMNGATFVDMGNIWLTRPNEINKDEVFRFDKFLSQVAIGTGFGLRFDMDYFVMRLDAGLKVKDPQFSGADQWVIRNFFNAREFREAYYQSHRPDRYSFIQYNFGVGLPF